MEDRFNKGTFCDRTPACAYAIGYGGSYIAGLRVVMCKQFWLDFGQLGETVLQRPSNPRVKITTLPKEQALVSRILHQRMLEDESRVRNRPTLIDQFGLNQLLQLVAKPLPCQSRNFRQQ